jgi:hypothetical protein
MPSIEQLYFRFMVDGSDKSDLERIRDHPYEAVNVYASYAMFVARVRLVGVAILVMMALTVLTSILENLMFLDFTSVGVSQADGWYFIRLFFASLIIVIWYVWDSSELKRRIDILIAWFQRNQLDETTMDLIDQRAKIDASGFAVKGLAPLLFLPVVLSIVLDILTDVALQNFRVPLGIVSMALGIGLAMLINRAYVADLIQHSVGEYKAKIKRIRRSSNHNSPAELLSATEYAFSLTAEDIDEDNLLISQFE